MKTLLLLIALGAFAQDREEPQPRAVDPGPPPADAVVLFDGKDLSQWQKPDGSPTGCVVDSGEMLCASGADHAVSRPQFQDAQIHLEFKIPTMPDQQGQARGNSGVYLQGRYEIQVLDSYNNPTYPTGSCGALYGQAAPLVNASSPPEQWQSYDIIFHAPRCGEGEVKRKATVTRARIGLRSRNPVRALRTGASPQADRR